MTREQIEKEARRWAKGEITKSRIARAERAFIAGAQWVLDMLCEIPLNDAVADICQYAVQKELDERKEERYECSDNG